MSTLNPSQLLEVLNWRYATKRFDNQKKIEDKTWKALEESLVLTPSSYGLQPWKFLVITNQELKNKLREVSWNQSQVSDCSHHVVFLAKRKMSEKDITAFIEDTAQTRSTPVESLEGYKKMMIGDVVNGARGKISLEWATRQVYIALGNFMTSAALLGVDTCPMEGIDPAAYDKILSLENSEYTTVVACPAGYRSNDDKYAQAQKVRFSLDKMIEHR